MIGGCVVGGRGVQVSEELSRTMLDVVLSREVGRRWRGIVQFLHSSGACEGMSSASGPCSFPARFKPGFIITYPRARHPPQQTSPSAFYSNKQLQGSSESTHLPASTTPTPKHIMSVVSCQTSLIPRICSHANSHDQDLQPPELGFRRKSTATVLLSVL